LPTAPPGLWQQQRQQHRDTRARRPGPSLREIVVGKGFFTTYGARVIAGRQFDDAHGADDSYGTKSSENRAIMINRTAVPVLGFRSAQDAVGKTLGKGRPRTIIGVVDDMRFYSPHVPMDATYYTYFSHYLGAPVITARYSGRMDAAMDAVRATWRKIAPEVPFDAAPVDQDLAKLFEADDHAANLFTIGSVLAVLIGCVGLWGWLRSTPRGA
jgi:putative ABC transport system permease protein